MPDPNDLYDAMDTTSLRTLLMMEMSGDVNVARIKEINAALEKREPTAVPDIDKSWQSFQNICLSADPMYADASDFLSSDPSSTPPQEK